MDGVDEVDAVDCMDVVDEVDAVDGEDEVDAVDLDIGLISYYFLSNLRSEISNLRFQIS